MKILTEMYKGYRIEQQIDELLNTKLWVKKKDFAMYAEQK